LEQLKLGAFSESQAQEHHKPYSKTEQEEVKKGK
jgi:hypothetical protein